LTTSVLPPFTRTEVASVVGRSRLLPSSAPDFVSASV